MKIQMQLIAVGVVATLPACGGSGGGGKPPPAEILNVTSGPAPGGYNPDTGVLVLNGNAIADSADRAIDSRDNAAVTSNGTSVFQAHAEGRNVFAVGYVDMDGSEGTVIGRNQVPNLPDSGSARFSGGYAGISTRATDPNNPAFSAAVTGCAMMNVDLGRMKIDGRIADRTAVGISGAWFLPNITAEDVILETTTLTSDGLFNGGASGGEFLRPGLTFAGSARSYKGVLGGRNGEEVAGSFRMNHTRNDGQIYEERGVFVAD